MTYEDLLVKNRIMEMEPVSLALKRLSSATDRTAVLVLKEIIDVLQKTPYTQENEHYSWVIWKNNELFSLVTIDFSKDKICEGLATFLYKKDGAYIHKLSSLDKLCLRNIFKQFKNIIQTWTRKDVDFSAFSNF